MARVFEPVVSAKDRLGKRARDGGRLLILLRCSGTLSLDDCAPGRGGLAMGTQPAGQVAGRGTARVAVGGVRLLPRSGCLVVSEPQQLFCKVCKALYRQGVAQCALCCGKVTPWC